MISKCQICLSSSSTDCDSSSEESEPGPAPKKKREKQQEISMLMATDEEEQTEGSILEINVKNVQCWLFWNIQNQYRFAIKRHLASCVAVLVHLF